MSDKNLLTLLPSERVLEVGNDENILEALRDEGIYIKSSCGGHASCTDCVIKIVDGEGNLNQPTFDETQLLGNVFHITKERLACQSLCKGPVTIDISRHDKAADEMKLVSKNSPVSKPRVRKKEDVDQLYKDRSEKRAQKEEERKTLPQKQSGFKRPKTFRTDHLEEEDPKKK